MKWIGCQSSERTFDALFNAEAEPVGLVDLDVRVLANDDNADALRRARSRPCEDLRANEDYDMQAVNIDCLASSVGGKMVFLLAASCARKDISSL